MAQQGQFMITRTLVKGDPTKTITRWEHEDPKDRKSPKVKELGTTTFPEIVGYEIKNLATGQTALVSKQRAVEAVAKDILDKKFAFVDVDLGHRYSKVTNEDYFYIRSKGAKNSLKDPNRCINILDENKKVKPEFMEVYAEYESTKSKTASKTKAVDKQTLATKALEKLAALKK